MASKPAPGKLAAAVVKSVITVAGTATGQPNPVPPLANYGESSIRQQGSKATRDTYGASRDKGRGSSGSSGK